jgi:AcrR family transcriptional regulator
MRSRDPEKERLIRENALKLFFKEGLEGFSMQKLARASSVSPATLYIYFKDKNDLILSIYREEMQKMSDYALRGFDPEMPFAEGLRVQWKNRALYYMEHPLPSHFLEQIRYTPFHEQAAKLADPVFLHAMRTFMENAVKRRELARLPLEVFLGTCVRSALPAAQIPHPRPQLPRNAPLQPERCCGQAHIETCTESIETMRNI